MKDFNYYLVGGAVRDKLLGLDPKDLDYCVEAPSYEDMEQWVLDKGGTIFPVPNAKANFTIRCKIGNEAADFVLCRKEGPYSDGRRPDFVEQGTLFDDLQRRDFTVNAMAICQKTGEVHDPFGGQSDLKDNLLVCVGSAKLRFTEDYLRIVRAMRFCIVKGFELDDDIEDCLRDEGMVANLSKISAERIYEELKKCFEYSTAETLKFLNERVALRDVIFYDCKLQFVPKNPKDVNKKK